MRANNGQSFLRNIKLVLRIYMACVTQIFAKTGLFQGKYENKQGRVL